MMSEFGNRKLDDTSRVFEHNAWDDVEWSEEQKQKAEEQVRANSAVHMSADKAAELESNAGSYWDSFYGQHQNRFFKDRNWLFREFPELNEVSKDGEDLKVLEVLILGHYFSPFTGFRVEVGCGVGNTVFPILSARKSGVFVYCCDFSESAVKLVEEHEDYDRARCSAFQWDITDSAASIPVPPASVHIITAVFVLSAIPPEKHLDALRNLEKLLAPGGRILIRDYARYDLAQLRFKPGRCIRGSLYARGDGTLVYFWEERELEAALTALGLARLDSHLDRRLVVNRGRQLTMFRSWLQAKYLKPPTT